ncbi:MAG: hypothetical protein FJ030_17205 [Chloroflexi bacterium]|nr:hypothetical protein [Chloroflexota bacterium]
MVNPTDLVLVAIMPSQRDLEIARVLGWYRIPYKKAPKTVSVDRIAFYQTARFGDEKWAINFTAPVLGHELVTRAELLRTERDHPRADEQYFKIQIGPLERLPRPLPSLKWRRITFLYTTGERLMKATEINDLIVDSEERELLWTALKERGMKAEVNYEAGRGMQVDFALLCALGNLGVVLGDGKGLKERGEWKCIAIPEAEVKNDLPGVMQKIEAEVSRLGGQ